MTTPRGFNSTCRLLASILCTALFLSPAWAAAPASDDQAPGRTMAQQATKTQTLWTTTDHSKHKALQKTFSSGQEITQACLSCHSEAEQQFKQTIHWTWVGHTDENGKQLGKAGDSLNNFCLSTNRMEDKGCSACHTGWQGKSQGVNCLATAIPARRSAGPKHLKTINAFSESDDPEELDIAREIQTEIQTAAQSISRPGAPELRRMPFQRRRRRRRQTRRSGHLPDQAQPRPGCSHGGRRAEFRLHPLPHHRPAPC
jgi:cytochrome c1